MQSRTIKYGVAAISYKLTIADLMTKIGTVVSWNSRKGFGCIKVNGENTTLAIRLKDNAHVHDGVRSPEYYNTDGPTVQPKVNDVVRFTEGKNHLRIRCVKVWVHERFWQDSIRRIAKRPVYKVMERIEYADQPVGEMTEVPNATGTAEELNEQYPRGVKPDRLAHFACAGHTTNRYFMRKEADGSWTFCPDPRPEPLTYCGPYPGYAKDAANAYFAQEVDELIGYTAARC